jgi:hypothetical protein
LVTCFGILSIFDDFETVVEALLQNLAEDGLLVIHALFNPDDIDVLVTYRDNAYSQNWQRGFNIFSRLRVLEWLARRGFAGRFHDVILPVNVEKRPHQPHRAHTLPIEDGSRRSVNGLCQILPESLLCVSKLS